MTSAARRCSVLIAAVGALAVLSARQAPPEHTLVLIDKAAVRRLPSDVVALVSPVEELERAWIARVAVAALDQVSAAGPVQRLPAAAPGEAHYLVFDPSGDEVARLRARGTLVQADASTWILVAAEDRIREGIPSRVAFKRLAGTAVGPITAPAATGAEDRVETPAEGHAAPVHLADLVSPIGSGTRLRRSRGSSRGMPRRPRARRRGPTSSSTSDVPACRPSPSTSPSARRLVTRPATSWRRCRAGPIRAAS